MLYDLTACGDEQILGIATLRVMLYLFKYIRTPELNDRLASILKMLAQETRGSVREALIAFTVYLLNTTDIPAKTLSHIVTENISQEGGNLIMTTAEKLIQQGIEKGKIEAIEAILEIRFGANALGLLKQIREIHCIEKLSAIQTCVKNARDWQECVDGVNRLLEK